VVDTYKVNRLTRPARWTAPHSRRWASGAPKPPDVPVGGRPERSFSLIRPFSAMVRAPRAPCSWLWPPPPADGPGPPRRTPAAGHDRRGPAAIPKKCPPRKSAPYPAGRPMRSIMKAAAAAHARIAGPGTFSALMTFFFDHSHCQANKWGSKRGARAPGRTATRLAVDMRPAAGPPRGCHNPDMPPQVLLIRLTTPLGTGCARPPDRRPRPIVGWFLGGWPTGANPRHRPANLHDRETWSGRWLDGSSYFAPAGTPKLNATDPRRTRGYFLELPR